MKNLRNLIATITLMAVLMVSASTARAGILMTDELTKSEAPQPCTTETKVDSGILVTFTGILVTFTGILVTFSDDKVDCGILVTDK